MWTTPNSHFGTLALPYVKVDTLVGALVNQHTICVSTPLPVKVDTLVGALVNQHTICVSTLLKLTFHTFVVWKCCVNAPITYCKTIFLYLHLQWPVKVDTLVGALVNQHITMTITMTDYDSWKLNECLGIVIKIVKLKWSTLVMPLSR